MKTQNESCQGPSWEVMSSPRKPAAGSAQDWESGAGGPLGSFAFLKKNLSNRESIEILVSPFFCLSPTHMVPSLVSYFSFLSFFFFFESGVRCSYHRVLQGYNSFLYCIICRSVVQCFYL